MPQEGVGEVIVLAVGSEGQVGEPWDQSRPYGEPFLRSWMS